jgi:hypothetical protein
VKTKRVILFRFDRDPLVCRGRVELLRALNPGVPICGVFGGARGPRRAFFRLFGGSLLRLDSLYCSPRAAEWNWKNGDLVLADWYRKAGHRIDFEIAHVIEWDLLLLDSLERVYSRVPDGAVGLTCLTPLSLVDHDWEWLQRREGRRQWEELLEHVRDVWGYDDIPYACLGVGPCFPRAFLAQYASTDPTDLCHDELRLPLFAQILGFPIADTGFRLQWHDQEEDRLFNVGGPEIEPRTVMAELSMPTGRRAFHPYRSAERRLGRA